MKYPFTKLETVVLIVCVLSLILIIFYSTGCTTLKTVPVATTPPSQNSSEVIYKAISTTDWTSSIFIIGIVLCTFAALNGLKQGWIGAASVGVGMFLKAGLSNTWVWTMCGVLLVCSVALGIISVIVRYKALYQVVSSVENQKKHDRVFWDYSYKEFFTKQSKDTQKVVKQMKKDIRKKEKKETENV